MDWQKWFEQYAEIGIRTNEGHWPECEPPVIDVEEMYQAFLHRLRDELLGSPIVKMDTRGEFINLNDFLKKPVDYSNLTEKR